MTEFVKINQSEWATILQRIRTEVATLSEVERSWLTERLAVIATVQLALDDLFCKAGGLASCAGCDGACCGCGRHHVTLTNLLAYLLEDEEPPVPDFSRTCPYLGETGCLLPVARRPYNCITFFCELLEEQLNLSDRQRLRTLDRQLRSEYQRIAERYPAATLRGLLIALERAGESRLLRSREQDVIQ